MTTSAIIFLIGRIMFGGYFVMMGFNHFKNHQMLTGYAASKKVPMPSMAVYISGRNRNNFWKVPCHFSRIDNRFLIAGFFYYPFILEKFQSNGENGRYDPFFQKYGSHRRGSYAYCFLSIADVVREIQKYSFVFSPSPLSHGPIEP